MYKSVLLMPHKTLYSFTLFAILNSQTLWIHFNPVRCFCCKPSPRTASVNPIALNQPQFILTKITTYDSRIFSLKWNAKRQETVPKLVVQGQWIVKDDCRFNSSNQLQPSWITSVIQYSKLQWAESSLWNLILFDKWDHHLSYTRTIHLGQVEER